MSIYDFGSSVAEPVSVTFTRTCSAVGSSMAALDAGVPLRDAQLAARHADPRMTTIYDRRRENGQSWTRSLITAPPSMTAT